MPLNATTTATTTTTTSQCCFSLLTSFSDVSDDVASLSRVSVKSIEYSIPCCSAHSW